MSQNPDAPQPQETDAEQKETPPKPVKRVLILGRDTQLGSTTPADGFVDAPPDTPPPDMATAGVVPPGYGISYGNRLSMEEEDKDAPRRPSLSPDQAERKLREARRADAVDSDVEVSTPPPPPATPQRRIKTLTLAEAVERFLPGDGVDTLAVGGMHMHNTPMALVREMLRQGKHARRLIGGLAGNINVDLLVGAGLVQEIVAAYVGFEHLGLAPAFRRMVQAGAVRMVEMDELTLLVALRAGAAGLPFAALPYGASLSDLPAAAPDYFKAVTDPFSNTPTLAVPPLTADVAFIVAAEADEFGNCTTKGSIFIDKEIAAASRAVIIQTERIVPTEQITRNPLAVTYPAALVAAVVVAPFSCHPTAHHRFYRHDEPHLTEYQQLAATADGFARYLEKYDIAPGKTEVEYLGHTQVAQ